MTSFISAPRSILTRCSPSTQEMASATFDLPHPFGPTTAVMPLPVKTSSVKSAKDLKPVISSFWSLNMRSSVPKGRAERGWTYGRRAQPLEHHAEEAHYMWDTP